MAGEGSGAPITRSEPTRPENRKSGCNPLRPLEPQGQGCGGCKSPAGPLAPERATGRVWEGRPPIRPLPGRHKGRAPPSPVTTARQVVTGRAAGAAAVMGASGARRQKRVNDGRIRVRRGSFVNLVGQRAKHLGNNPTGHGRPFSPERTTYADRKPTRHKAHQPKPPPTCAALRARHGGAKIGNQRKDARCATA